MDALQNELSRGSKGNGDDGGVVTKDALRIAMGVNEMGAVAVFVHQDAVTV